MTAYRFCRRNGRYTVAADKEKQFKTLKELMHRADASKVRSICLQTPGA